MSRIVIRYTLSAAILGVVVFLGAEAARAGDPAVTVSPSPMGYGRATTVYGTEADASCDEEASFCSSCRDWLHASFWNCCLYRRTVEHHREKQFYHMYIRGFGPAIHERPVGRCW